MHDQQNMWPQGVAVGCRRTDRHSGHFWSLRAAPVGLTVGGVTTGGTTSTFPVWSTCSAQI